MNVLIVRSVTFTSGFLLAQEVIRRSPEPTQTGDASIGGPYAGLLYEVQDQEGDEQPRAGHMKNGRPATKGICPTCGTKMFKIGKS